MSSENKIRVPLEVQTAALEAAANAIIFTDREGIILWVNQAASKLTGYSKEELIGQSPMLLNSGKHSKAFFQNLWDTILAGQVWHDKTINRRKDGTLYIEEQTITPIPGQDDRSSYFISIKQDVTDREQAQDSLRMYCQQLVDAQYQSEKQANALVRQTDELIKARNDALAAISSKSQFFAQISHELRTPLTAIVGYSSSLMEESPSQEETHTALEAISRNGKHLLGLVNDILDISKIEAGKLEVHLQDFSLIEMVNDVFQLLERNAAEKGISFEIEYSFPLPEKICSDQTRVRQILLNLLGNAIKFTKQGFVKLLIEYDQQQDLLLFHAIDSGIGLSKEQQEKIFDAFSQADSSISQTYGGFGLGLAICRQLSEKLGGSLAVKSNPDQGSVFTATINPGEDASSNLIYSTELKEDQERVAAEQKKIKPGHELSGHILLADDVESNRQLISFLLRKFNKSLKVSCVENGELAVKYTKDHSIDLIFMDLAMPKMDGYAATHQLRENGFGKPVIALTAHLIENGNQSLLEAGFDAYLAKPFEPEDLFAVLDKYLNKEQSESSTLDEEAQNDQKMNQIIANFVKTLPERLSQIESAAADTDWDNLTMYAHRLQSAGLFGYRQLTKTAGGLHWASQAKNEAVVAERIAQLRDQIQQIVNNQS